MHGSMLSKKNGGRFVVGIFFCIPLAALLGTRAVVQDRLNADRTLLPRRNATSARGRTHPSAKHEDKALPQHDCDYLFSPEQQETTPNLRYCIFEMGKSIFMPVMFTNKRRATAGRGSNANLHDKHALKKPCDRSSLRPKQSSLLFQPKLASCQLWWSFRHKA